MNGHHLTRAQFEGLNYNEGVIVNYAADVEADLNEKFDARHSKSATTQKKSNNNLKNVDDTILDYSQDNGDGEYDEFSFGNQPHQQQTIISSSNNNITSNNLDLDEMDLLDEQSGEAALASFNNNSSSNSSSSSSRSGSNVINGSIINESIFYNRNTPSVLEGWEFLDLENNLNLVLIKNMFTRNSSFKAPTDCNDQIIEGDLNGKSKGHLALKFIQLQAKYSVKDAFMLDFMGELAACIPSAKLPVGFTKNGVLKLCFNEYVPGDNRKYKVHVCIKGCSAYLEGNTEIMCFKCGEYRFAPCPATGCKDPINCDPYTGLHTISRRRPYRAYYYRPIITLFQQLVELAISEPIFEHGGCGGFGGDNVDESTLHNRMVDNDYLYDIMDGTQATTHMREMGERFLLYKATHPDVIEVSLVASQSYDGGQLFNRHNMKSVWPLVISILNCSPHDRVVEGRGLFVVALHDLTVGTVAEKSIFSELFVPELQMLGQGMAFKVVDKNGDTREFYLQVRLIVHIMDTKALEKMAEITGPNSLDGCQLCNSGGAISRKLTGMINKVVNPGHRKNLAADHPFRYVGASRQCCPAGYYDGSKESVLAVQALFGTFNPNINVFDTRKTITSERAPHSGCDGVVSDAPATTSRKLCNSRFKMSDFEPISYAHCDFRKPRIYERNPDSYYRSSVVNDAHDRLALREMGDAAARMDGVVQEHFDDAEADDGRQRVVNPFADDPIIPDEMEVFHSGVRGTWRYDMLPSARIRCALSYDPFHAIYNLVMKLIGLLNGKLGSESQSIKLCLVEGRIPELILALRRNVQRAENAAQEAARVNSSSSSSSSSKPPSSKRQKVAEPSVSLGDIPFALSNSDINKFDSAQNCILIPVGLVSDYCIKNPLSATHLLKGHEKIAVLTTFINFNISFTDLPKDYKNVLELISCLLSDITSPVIRRESNIDAKVNYESGLDDLLERTEEMLSLYEGKYPDSVCLFVCHELLDVVFSIRSFGPVRCWWAYPIERLMKVIKDQVSSGGKNPLQKTYQYYVAKEDNMRYYFNHAAIEFLLDNRGRPRDNRIVMLAKYRFQFESLIYWNNWIVGKFWSTIHNFLETSTIPDLLIFSPVARLYATYLKCRDSFTRLLSFKDNSRDCSPVSITFFRWVRYIVKSNFRNDNMGLLFVDYTNRDPSTMSTHSIQQFIDKRFLFTIDKITLREIAEFKPIGFNAAVIKGLKFRCRGAEFCESLPPLPGVVGPARPREEAEDLVQRGKHYNSANHPRQREGARDTSKKTSVEDGAARYGTGALSYPTNNPLNNLTENWSLPAQYSCWAKYKVWYHATESRAADPLDKKFFHYRYNYAQLNYCFRLNIKSDSVLDGLSFANITSRFFNKKDEKRDRITNNHFLDIYDETKGKGWTKQTDGKYTPNDHLQSSYDFEHQFTCLNYVVSTNVGVCGVNDSNVPILCNLDNKSSTASTAFVRDVNSVKKLHFLDLNPNRRNVNISLEDSKLWEENGDAAADGVD